ncbi:MAG: type 1 glutamine amidotransferase [Nitrospinae bacterium]|nr:type 1 glutamine amidotransferase [Nitrospinota bacterium]
MEDAKAVVVLGGPMGVYEAEKYPWLADELRFLGGAIRAGVPVYGLCLGAQLMAAALDARVYPGEGKKEIGWFPVDLTPEAQGDPLLGDEEASFPVFQWHGDTFDIPEGAVHLASSARYPNQGARLRLPVSSGSEDGRHIHLAGGVRGRHELPALGRGPRGDIARCAGSSRDFEQARGALVRALARPRGACLVALRVAP